jgi:hypothetical protein
VTYLKGSYTGCPGPTHWTWSPAISNGTYLECINEDNNPIFFGSHPDWALNGVLNSGGGQTEDINEDGLLTPGNVAEVNRTATTDANGFAQFYVIYAKQFASWVKVKIEGRIYSYGDQTLGATQFYLPVLRDDVACAASPPGGISPFGLGAAPANVCTYVAATGGTAPTDLTATAVSSTRINLTWTEPVGGAKGYNVYRNRLYSPGAYAGWVLLGSVSSLTIGTTDAETVSDMAGAWIYPTGEVAPTAHVQYCYSIKAWNEPGNESPATSTVCVATP